MIITHTFSDGPSEFNSSRWRSANPTRALIQAGHKVHLIHIDQWMKDTDYCRRACADSDIIILQRVMVEEGRDRAKYWKEKGKTLVVDFDDAYQLIDNTNAAHKFWGNGTVEISAPYGVKFEKSLDRHPIEQFIEGVSRYCAGATMPGRVLADEWKRHFPCWYLPNYVDTSTYLPALRRPKLNTGKIIIGYGGSLSHVNSFKLSGIEEALRRVFIQRKNVRLLISGDDRIYKQVPVPNDRKSHLGYVLWNDWPNILRRYDITIAPLAGTYDYSRSSIKCVEAAVMGIPIVATGCIAYKDFMDNNIGHFVSQGDDEQNKSARSDEWESKILQVIDNWEDEKEKMSHHTGYMMREWDVDNNVDKIVGVYENIVSGK